MRKLTLFFDITISILLIYTTMQFSACNTKLDTCMQDLLTARHTIAMQGQDIEDLWQIVGEVRESNGGLDKAASEN